MASTVKRGRPNSWILPDSASMQDSTTTESQQFGMARVVGVVGAGGGERYRERENGRVAAPSPYIPTTVTTPPAEKSRRNITRPSDLAIWRTLQS